MLILLLNMDVTYFYNKQHTIGMSNIYLKVTIAKNQRSQNFDFLGLKNLSPVHLLVSFNSRRYH